MPPLIFCFSLLLILPQIIFTQSIIKNLPGYPGELPFKLETGYIGVGEEEDVQLFYYFVESERSPQFDPLIIWLAGGPGCSTLRAFFYEIGPLVFNYAKSSGSKPILDLNPYSWTSVANIIFLDAPVSTGFSYSKTRQSYNSSDTLSAAHITEFLRKWLIDHPRFTNNRLYVTGVSYSGIIIPMITEELYKGNEERMHPHINIKDMINRINLSSNFKQGYMIGNPLTDEYSDINSRIPYAHRLTLLSDELYKSIKTNCDGNYIQVAANNTPCLNDMQLAKECVERINIQCILEPVCGTVTGKQNLLEWDPNSFEDNPIKLPSSRPQVPASGPWCRGYNYVYVSIWANDRAVQDALHVREGTVDEWWLCNGNSTFSFPVKETSYYTFDVLSVVDYHRNLTKKRCRALIFSGDHDMLVPHLGTEKWIRSLNLTIENNWAPWLVEGQVAGYTETHSYNEYTLTYATVKGAGHTAPEFKPKECLAMVDRWFAYYPL